MIGNIYKAKGGRGTTAYWLVIGMVGRYAICLGMDKDGNLVSCTKYADYYLESKEPVGTFDVRELRIGLPDEPRVETQEGWPVRDLGTWPPQ